MFIVRRLPKMPELLMLRLLMLSVPVLNVRSGALMRLAAERVPPFRAMGDCSVMIWSEWIF